MNTMSEDSFRVTGRVVYLQDDNSLGAIPSGTLVTVQESDQSMILRWTNATGKTREQRYPFRLWTLYIRGELEQA
jgi:hypothetical protein